MSTISPIFAPSFDDAGLLVPAPADFGTALAEGFARRIGRLARHQGASAAAVQWAERAAFAISRATSEGHVCVPLVTLAERHGVTLDTLHAALIASGVVTAIGSDGAAERAASLPLVIDRQARLYLARYYDYERRLAESLVAHARAANAFNRPDGDDDDVGHRHDEAALGARLQRYFGPPKDAAIDWQRVAAVAALSGQLTIVSGGPGTGKTTTVVGILACLLDADAALRIALAAPTGKAAQRMQEALLARAGDLPPELAARLPQTSYTLHRLLGFGPNGRFRHHRDNPLPYDVVVIDEASMIDVAMAAQLLDAVAPRTRLVMLGDKDQLAAVEAGAVFAELSARPAFSEQGVARMAAALGIDGRRLTAALPAIDAPRPSNAAEAPESAPTPVAHESPAPFPDDLFAETDSPTAEAMPVTNGTHRTGASRDTSNPLSDCVIWLERNYRFGLDSPIGRLSLAIRRGDAQGSLDALDIDPIGPSAAALFEDAGHAPVERTIARLAAGFAPYADALKIALNAATPDAEPLFDALNRFRILCATRDGQRGVDQMNASMALQVRRGAGVSLAIGASWFAGRPVMVTRNDYALGLFNGDIGIALPGADGKLRVFFRTGDGGLRTVSPAALPPHDTAFALTVHKSQGSEFEHAVLMLPATFSRVLSRELVYTAITRARDKVEVVGARAVLAQAIATPTRRDSGLAARIDEVAGREWG